MWSYHIFYLPTRTNVLWTIAIYNDVIYILTLMCEQCINSSKKLRHFFVLLESAHWIGYKRAAFIIFNSRAYSQSRHHLLDIGFKDFVFATLQIYNLNGINLSERYCTIQIMIIFMVVVIFHMFMWLCINILVKNQQCKKWIHKFVYTT